MSGTFDPAAMDAKLDRILGQLTTMNNRLDSHDARLARVETGKQKKNSRQIKYSNTYHTMDDKVPNNGLVFLYFLIWEILAARIEWCFQDTLWSIRPSSTPKHICIVSATHLNYLFLINRMCIAFLGSQESECSRSDIM